MRVRCREVIAELETRPPVLPAAQITEGLEFLRWLDDEHFTYLGYREFAFQGSGANAVSQDAKVRGLGILRDQEVRVFGGLRNLGELPSDERSVGTVWVGADTSRGNSNPK